MTQRAELNDPRLFAGRVAVIGALIAWGVVPLYLAATHLDLDLMKHPAAALALSAKSQRLHGWSLWADVLGMYLPFIVVGGYLWSRMRSAAGVMADIATMAILAFAIMGVVGASKLIPTLTPLSDLHASDGGMARTAAEAAWLALGAAAQGAWEIEGVLFVLWGVIAARFLRAQNWGFGSLLNFDVWLFGALFLLKLINWKGFAAAEDLLVLTIHAIHPLWLLMFGMSVLQGRAQTEVTACTVSWPGGAS